jgi:SnoaL-like domain
MTKGRLVDSDADGLRSLLDREKIRHCIAAVARGEDRRDADLIRASYWPDATCDYGIFTGSLPDYLDWVLPGSPAIVVTQHILGQILITLSKDTAQSETHVIGYHRVDVGDGNIDTAIVGRYLDRLERREEEWRIAERTMIYDWFQNFGTSADWSHGLMGMPLRGDHHIGRATGDFSQTFFAARESPP